MEKTRLKQAVLMAAMAACLANLASGQQTTPPSGGGGGGGTGAGGGGAAGGGTPTTPGGTPTTPGGTPTTPGGTPTFPGRTTPQTGNQTDMMGMEMQRPIFLSGRVMMDDGMPPPEPVTILMVCGTTPRPQAYTDNKGRFSFTPGQNQALFADASTGGFNDMTGFSRTSSRNTMPGMSRTMGANELMSCELRADLPGYRSDVVNLAGRRPMDNPDVGILVLHRLANVEGFTYSMTSANAPKDARKAFDKGKELAKKGKTAEAEAQFQKAVDAYPKYAAAWSELGKAQAQQKKTDVAQKSFEQAVEADPKFLEPYLGLLQSAVNARDWARIAEASEHVVKLNPFNYPQAWFFNGVANYNLGKKDAAEKSAKEAFKLDVDHKNPKISHLLGVILAERGDYAGAKDQFQNYLAFAPLAPDAETVKKQLGELERVMAARAQTQDGTPPQQQ